MAIAPSTGISAGSERRKRPRKNSGTSIELPGVDFMYEKRIQGSLMGSNQFRTDMPRYADLYLQGRLKLDELVSACISLDEVNSAFEEMQRGSIARSVIVFD